MSNISVAQITLMYARLVESVILHSEGCNKVPMAVVVDFLQKSGCSLERFSLLGAMDKSNVTSLCQGMSTLQHLQIDFSDFPSVLELNAFLTLLAECLFFNGEIKFRCLPMLSSITLICYDHSDT
ncbi:hypothetical protein BDN70DRAFT_599743 [Pholiota conissans]|uniref:Uncharacterized protein n=1 Tax=Pholiota conissans TaxID=109636 RepID=A0A9P5Z4C4_9AGAR|nr:hypothetical protein BDN70DRAFT_599743 [Pholiota conissans]